MPKEIELTLYSKPDCPLCDEMVEVMLEVGKKIPIHVQHVDITSDAGLQERYGLDIPVLMCGNECLAKHRAHEKTIYAKIAKIRNVMESGCRAEG